MAVSIYLFTSDSRYSYALGGANEESLLEMDGSPGCLYRNGGPGDELIRDMATGASSGTVDLLAALNQRRGLAVNPTRPGWWRTAPQIPLVHRLA